MAEKVAKTDIKSFFNSEQIKFGAMFAELIGVFVLTAAALATSSVQSGFNVLIAGLAYLIMWLVVSPLSGAHLNPAVTIGLLSAKQIAPIKAFGYVIAQLLGAMLALIVIMQFFNANPDAVAAGIKVYEIPALKDLSWLPVMAELTGAVIFGFGIGSVVLGKKQGFDAAFTAGGSLLLALAIGSLGTVTLINPALAIGVDGFSSWAAVLVYAVMPIIGVTAGIWIFKALQWEVKKGKA